MSHHPACPWWRLKFSESKGCPMCMIVGRMYVTEEQP